MKNDGGADAPNSEWNTFVGSPYPTGREETEKYKRHLRDYMAGQALALIKWQLDEGFKNEQRPEYCKELAQAAYQIADAMIAQRGKVD